MPTWQKSEESMRTAIALSILVTFFGCANKEELPAELVRQPDDETPVTPCTEELCIRQVKTLDLHPMLLLGENQNPSVSTQRLVIATGVQPVKITGFAINVARTARVFRNDTMSVTLAGFPGNTRGDWEAWQTFPDRKPLPCDDPYKITMVLDAPIVIPGNTERVYDLHFQLRDSPVLTTAAVIRTAVQEIETTNGFVTCPGNNKDECWLIGETIEAFPPGVNPPVAL